MNRDELIAFEDDIAAEFNAGRIPYPVHLTSGNEDQLIEVFRDIQPNDWVLGTWRSHYHCLLKGVPRETLKAAIMDGESIALSFPKYRVLCSAIAGGMIPTAVGIALGIKRSGRRWKKARGAERVYCFMGDMMAESGVAHESMKYAKNHSLPIRWIVEDNGLSVCTDTYEVWNGTSDWESLWQHVTYYQYDSEYPHAGAGERVQF